MATVEPMFAGMSQAEASERLERAGIPFAPINRPTDLFDDPHMQAGGLVDVTLPRGVHAGEAWGLPALPLEMAQGRLDLFRDLPVPGGDTREVLAGAGYSDEDIDHLLAQGRVEAD